MKLLFTFTELFIITYCFSQEGLRGIQHRILNISSTLFLVGPTYELLSRPSAGYYLRITYCFRPRAFTLLGPTPFVPTNLIITFDL